MNTDERYWNKPLRPPSTPWRWPILNEGNENAAEIRMRKLIDKNIPRGGLRPRIARYRRKRIREYIKRYWWNHK